MNNIKQNLKNNETPVARTTEASANNSQHMENQTSQYIMGYKSRLVDAKSSTIFADPLLVDITSPISTQISTLDRNDLSDQNIKKARKLLSFTGSSTRYCASFLKNGKELQTAWFKTRERAKKALDILIGKGFKTMIYAD